MKKVTVSAPGKIHLMGEHAVVYGKPALLSAVNLRTTVSLSENKKFEIISEEPDEYIRYTIERVCKDFKKKIPSVRLQVSSTIPTGFHLGSSAAIAVATVGAMYYFFTKKWDLEKINALAYEVEKKMHGNPSGGDNTTVSYGGFVLYRKKSETEKIFQQLSLSIPKNLNHFLLINTGRPKENTGQMVALVREKFTHQTEKYNELFNINEQQVDLITEALKKGNEKALIDAIQKGEQTLEDMGVVSEKVKPLIRDIEKNRGAAKILGGGGISEGVGFLLCYYNDIKSIKSTVSTYGYSVQNIRLGEEGVRIEKNP
jgi:mevalonate kinase